MLLRAYFGRTQGNGAPVDSLAVERFLREDVSPIIPGFTVYESLGYWRGAREASFILEVFADRLECALVSEQLDSLARLYCERFAQECVLVSAVDSEPRFVSSPSPSDTVKGAA